MEEKLNEIARRYEEISARLYDPQVTADPAVYESLMKELNLLRPIAEAYDAYRAAGKQLKEAEQILTDGSADKELRELAQDECASCREELTRLTDEMRILLLPRDPNDERNVIVEIRAGTGGEESALFAAALYRMYTMYAEKRHFSTEIVNENATELGGYKEISFMVTGDGAYSRFKFESGTHRVQRVPETESGGRIHTSAATVAILPEADEVDLEINPADLQIDTYRSSGAGGQHINKTESAIRITHLPTGTVVECQDERSQYKNKDKAMRVLRSRLLEREQQAQQSAIAADRKAQVGSGDRSERIRTYNFPQGRVTDHRIGLTLYKIDSIMDGDLDELVDALITADRADKLQQGGTETAILQV